MRRFEVCYKTCIGSFDSVYFNTLDEAIEHYFELITIVELNEVLIYDNKKKIMVVSFNRSKYYEVTGSN